VDPRHRTYLDRRDLRTLVTRIREMPWRAPDAARALSNNIRGVTGVTDRRLACEK